MVLNPHIGQSCSRHGEINFNAGASAAAAAHDSTQMWDFTLNKWVPNIMGTEDPAE